QRGRRSRFRVAMHGLIEQIVMRFFFVLSHLRDFRLDHRSAVVGLPDAFQERLRVRDHAEDGAQTHYSLSLFFPVERGALGAFAAPPEPRTGVQTSWFCALRGNAKPV